jgi:hypothetical protein
MDAAGNVLKVDKGTKSNQESAKPVEPLFP